MNDDFPSAETALKEALAPLLAIDLQLAEREAQLRDELNELRKERTKIRGVLRAIEPSKTRKGSVTENWTVAAKRVEEVQEYLEDHRPELNDEGFTFTGLAKEINLNGNPIGRDTIRKAIHVLHERGVVRLDSRTRNGGKLFKLT